MKIRELLSDESKWTKGANARDSDRHHVNAIGQHAVCWCILGAAHRVYPTDDGAFMKARDAINRAVRAIGYDDWVTWNDAPERTFKEVKELVDRLDV